MAFGVIAVGATGIDAAQRWMDIAASNTANSDDLITPGAPGFTATEPVFTELPNGGVGATAASSAPQSPVFLAVNPLGDATGYVQDPGVDLAEQMVDMTVASDFVAVNVAVINRAIDAYRSILDLGRDSSVDDS